MKRLSFNRKNIVLFCLGMLVISPFLQPYYLGSLAVAKLLHGYYHVARYIGVIFIVGYALLAKKKILRIIQHDFIFFVCFFILGLVMVVSTEMNDGDIINCAKTILLILEFLIIVICSNDSANKSFLKGIVFYYQLVLFLTFIIGIAVPVLPSLPRNYCILGQKNRVLRQIFPGIIFSTLNDFKHENQIGVATLLMIICSFALSIKLGSVVSFISLSCLLIVLFIVCNFEKKALFFTYRNYFLASIILFILVVYFRQYDFYGEFLGRFNRDITFTGRTYMWDEALKWISERPFLGHGFVSKPIFSVGWDYNQQSCHNFYLDILYRFGYIGLLLLFILLITLSNKITLIGRINKKFSIIMSALFLVYFISWNFEPFVDAELIYSFSPIIINYFSVPGAFNENNYTNKRKN